MYLITSNKTNDFVFQIIHLTHFYISTTYKRLCCIVSHIYFCQFGKTTCFWNRIFYDNITYLSINSSVHGWWNNTCVSMAPYGVCVVEETWRDGKMVIIFICQLLWMKRQYGNSTMSTLTLQKRTSVSTTSVEGIHL